jgi:plasmid stabilization system protein ParE
VNVVLTAAAEADLEEIGDWIAQDNPRRALSFVTELRESCDGLAVHPRRFALVERYRAHGVRRRVHGAYLILYVAETQQVSVLRILHGARDFEPLLFPGDEPA